MRASAVCLLLGAACGDTFSAAVMVELTGSTGAPGGQYRFDLRRPDGAALPGTAPRTIDFAPGRQRVAMVIEGDEVLGGGDQALARVFVEVLPSRDASPTALGSGLVTLVRGRTVELTIVLGADPRGITVPVAAAYGVGATGEQRLLVRAAEPLSLAGYMLHVWAEDEWLGAAAALGPEPDSELDLLVNGAAPLLERSGYAVRLTAEPGDSADRLARSSGWLLAAGVLETDVAAEVRVIMDAEHMGAVLDLTTIAMQHAGFARSAFLNGLDAEARLHAEHSYNSIVGAGNHLDLDGNGQPDTVAAVTLTSIESYRAATLALAFGLAERRGLTDVFDDIGRCSAALGSVLDLVDDTAVAFNDHVVNNRDAEATTAVNDLVSQSNRALGDPFSLTADASRQTAACMRDRALALSRFALAPVSPGS